MDELTASLSKLDIHKSDDVVNAVSVIQKYYRKHLVSKQILPRYGKTEILMNACKNMVGENVKLYASFCGQDYVISNCNLVGDVLETICLVQLQTCLDDIELGPKQASPDFWCDNRLFEYEHKVYMKQAGFDLANFESYVDQLCKPNGVFRKLFQTKYLVFEYAMEEGNIKILSCFCLNIWNLVGFTRKYPLSMQVKRGMWYNIRPASISDWTNKKKTPDMFVKAIIQCIKQCPNQIDDREGKIKNIQHQYANLYGKYMLKNTCNDWWCHHVSK